MSSLILHIMHRDAEQKSTLSYRTFTSVENEIDKISLDLKES